MFSRKSHTDSHAQIEAIGQSHTITEFNMDGLIITANKKFLETYGYNLEDIQGKHHSSVLPADQRDDTEYKDLWAALKRGESRTIRCRRLTKDGRELWIEASYNLIMGRDKRLSGVVEIATDIAQKQNSNIKETAKLAAINKTQAVIEFDLDGTILTANQNFLDALGYTLGDIQGKHHSMFVSSSERDTEAYREFWAKLNRGDYVSGEFKRIGKGGKEVWILASYNPIMDEKGRPFGVVKFATDVTASKLKNADFAGQIEAIGKSQAVITFNMDGTIVTANENFLHAVGYTLPEIQNRHHSIFVDADERNSDSYREFWTALNRGEYKSAEFKRIRKDGKEIYIQASYNPILDLNGKPFKVVKYAADVTRQVLVRIGNERVRSMMESVAAGSEELSASVREISEAMVKSRSTATGAVEQVVLADTQALRLTEATQSMSGIVQLIHDITGQINLLALNATIESARAGEAGRGFAVVASEVKNLANQAKQATDKIAAEIDSLNGISSDVVAVLSAIKTAINNVSEYVTSTAAAIEEQSAVTNEMSNSIQHAAAEASKIASGAA